MIWTLRLDTNKKMKIISIFNLFSLLFMDLQYFLVLFMSLTVLFQLNFIFIYSILSNKFFSFNKVISIQTDLNTK